MNRKYFVTVLVGIFWSICILCLELVKLIKNGSSYFKSPVSKSYPLCVYDEKYGKSCLKEVNTTKGNMESTTLNLHYMISGENNRDTILFLHGFPEFWYSWRYQIVEFSKTHRVIALDMRGYGLSDKPKNVEDYQVVHLANDIKALLESLNIKHVILVAHDWGGIVGWHFDSFPSKMVTKYITLNIPHPLAFRKVLDRSFKQFLKSWYIMFFQLPFLPEWILSRFEYKFIIECFTSKHMGMKKTKLSEEEVIAFQSNMSQKGALHAGINYYRAFLRFPSTSMTSPAEEENKYLFIFGDCDGAIEIETTKETQALIPSIVLKIIPGISHWVQQDDPCLVNKIIRDFINKAD